jgi:hypothetical protein
MTRKNKFALIVWVSVSLIASACSQNPGFKDSGIARALLDEGIVSAAAKPSGVRTKKLTGVFGGGVYRVELQTSFLVEATPLPPEVIKAYHREVESLIASRGAEVEGRGAAVGNVLTRFQFDYRWQSNQGIVRIRTENEPAGTRIEVFCYEHSR